MSILYTWLSSLFVWIINLTHNNKLKKKSDKGCYCETNYPVIQYVYYVLLMYNYVTIDN